MDFIQRQEKKNTVILRFFSLDVKIFDFSTGCSVVSESDLFFFHLMSEKPFTSLLSLTRAGTVCRFLVFCPFAGCWFLLSPAGLCWGAGLELGGDLQEFHFFSFSPTSKFPSLPQKVTLQHAPYKLLTAANWKEPNVLFGSSLYQC